MKLDDEIQAFKDIFAYDRESGELRWSINKGKVKRGDRAGCKITNIYGKSYIKVMVGRKRYFAHRIIWLIVYGETPKGHVDHIDGDGCNNRLENLRDVSAAENSKNIRKYKNNKTGVSGVSFCKRSGKFRARISVSGRLMDLGYFSSVEDASKARSAAEMNSGFHKNHGSERPL